MRTKEQIIKSLRFKFPQNAATTSRKNHATTGQKLIIAFHFWVLWRPKVDGVRKASK